MPPKAKSTKAQPTDPTIQSNAAAPQQQNGSADFTVALAKLNKISRDEITKMGDHQRRMENRQQ